jgi:hypothetical protein
MAGIIVFACIIGGGVVGSYLSSALTVAKIFTGLYNVPTMYRLAAAASTTIFGLSVATAASKNKDNMGGALNSQFLVGSSLLALGLGSFTSIASTDAVYAVSPLVQNIVEFIESSNDYVIAPIVTFAVISTYSFSILSTVSGIILKLLISS